MLSELNVRFMSELSPSNADRALAMDLFRQVQERGIESDQENYLRFLLAWKTKSLPRYFVSDSQQVLPDFVSQRWSTGYYRIDQSLSALRERLQGKKVLDPYAGSGSLEFALMTLGIIENVTLGDIAYPGGQPITVIDEVGYYYDPLKNITEYNKMLKSFVPNRKPLPKPSVVLVDTKKQIPFADNSFDYIITDPPYGVNFELNDCRKMFANTRFELLRVSKQGILTFIPESWIAGLGNVEVLTPTLTHKDTKLKTRLVHITKS